MNPLAKLLSARRTKYRLTLEEASGLLGVSKTHLWSMEAGREANPRMSTLAAIVREYRVTDAELVRCVRGATK